MESFAKALTDAAQRLGLKTRYYPSTISDIESGNRVVTLDDARVVAAVDPLRRGEAWLAFGLELGAPVLDLDPARDHRLTAEEAARAERVAAEKAPPTPRGTAHAGGTKKRRP